ncbi:MAG: GGDEF domain-containing protein, partial [Massilia sp.]
MQQAAATPIPIGVYLNPVGQRRVDFQTACAPRFGRLFVADGTEQATLLLAQQEVDLLVIDLERFEYSFDLSALGQLIALRGGARTLLVCPFTHAGWLGDLMAFGPCEYVISPLLDQDLCAQIAHGAPLPNEVPGQVGALLAASARLQQVIAEVDQFDQMADRICTALCELPGVVHASLFQLREMGDLELVAQFAPGGLNLT